MKPCAVLVGLVAMFTVAKAQLLPCTARDNAPCVSFDFDKIPPELPASLRILADEWLRSDIAGEGHLYESVYALHAQIDREWRQVYPYGGEGAGTPWSAERKFFADRSEVPGPWTSLLMVERYDFGGAHGNYRIVSRTVDESGEPVMWADFLNRSTYEVETCVRQHLAERYPEYDFNKIDPLPPDAWRATARHLELWWNPYRLGPFALEDRGPPRVQIRWKSILRLNIGAASDSQNRLTSDCGPNDEDQKPSEGRKTRSEP